MQTKSRNRSHARHFGNCPCGNYLWKTYYWRRPLARKTFESDYWGAVVDPDGKHRNLLIEKLQKIEDQRLEISVINGLKPGRVLDIGCGPGFTLAGIKNDWQKYGTEVSRVAAEHAKQYGQIFLGEISQAHFRSRFFDAALMIHVLRYVREPLKVIREVHRILRPGGFLVIAEADYDSGCARRFRSNYRLLHDKGIINLFTTLSLVKMLEHNRFKVMRLDFPFFETQWFTKKNLMRLFDVNKMSPPFYGNFVTLIVRKK